jgi:NAD-dependent dihydropyrimidine dehydrogenase PreA subunit
MRLRAAGSVTCGAGAHEGIEPSNRGGLSSMIMVTVDKNKCDGDGTCVNVCPQAVFKIENGKAEPVNMSECINCLTCVENCPQQAITVQEL